MQAPARVVGDATEVILYGGRKVPYANLDNAASTPALCAVADRVESFLHWYSNVHRGAGMKSRVSTEMYERARRRVLAFLGSSGEDHELVFTRNTTGSLNQIASLATTLGYSLITTEMEHHSNDLPWRRRGLPLRHARVTDDGLLDLDHLFALIAESPEPPLVAVAGASNVTGVVNPIKEIARRVHAAGGLICVDGAQLVPHRPVSLASGDDPAVIDLLAFSGHKLYAPFGAGVLVVRRDLLARLGPYEVGGGMVTSVSVGDFHWAEWPERAEAGTPPVVGAVAIAAACTELDRIGWPTILRHERELSDRMRLALEATPGVAVLGSPRADVVGVTAFVVDGVPHGLVASILDREWGIGTRSGCFCAHPYIKRMLKIEGAALREMERRVLAGELAGVPGAVRCSIGVYNTVAEVDRLLEAVGAVADGRWEANYREDARTGEWSPVGHEEVWLPPALGWLGEGSGRVVAL